MSGFDEISDQEKLKVAQHFLLSSPPAQFHEVLNDVRKLLPAGILSDALATGIARVYNTKTGRVVTAPSGKKVVIAGPGEVDATHYVDPSNNSVFGIDHLSLQTNEDHLPMSVNEALEPRRRAVYNAVVGYVAANYKPEDSGVSVFSTEDNKLVVVISSEKPNLRNFWSGRWTSAWTIANNKIAGNVKIHAHYFEDGNVQLQTTKPVAETALAGGASDAAFADAVVAFINNVESGMRSGLEDIFGNLNTETLRAMRRTMPVTRTKMEWNVNAVRMIRQVRK